jgi:radical SAM superfamily enzyme YgiQ (UPF0313 family)
MTRSSLLLINPWIYDFAAYDLWVKPLGLLYVARFLEQYGYECELVDCLSYVGAHCDAPLRTKGKNKYHTGKFPAEIIEKPAALKHIPRYYRRYGISPQEFKERLRAIERPRAILVTSIMTYWYLGLKDAVTIVKEIFPDVPVIVSGIYPRLCPNHARAAIPADHILTEGPELAALKIIDDLYGVKRDYDDIVFDICSLDRPAYHLYKNLSSVSMLTSVGCPLRCDYCASHLLQPFFKQRPVDNILREISYYKDVFDIKDIAFYDDALLIKAEHHIKPMLQKIIEKRFSIRFHTPNGLHVRAIDDGLAKLLFEAGFKTLRLSFESSDLARQQDSSSKITNSEFSGALHALRKAGFTNNELGVYMMIGLPGQSLDECRASLDFLASHNVPIRTVQYSPIPGTLYYSRATSDYGFIGNDPLFQNNSIFPLSRQDASYDAYQSLKNQVKNLNSSLTL